MTATVAFLSLVAGPTCSAGHGGFSDGRELLEATNVCAGPIENRNGTSWTCPSGRPDDSGEALIVAEVHDDPARLCGTVHELVEFSWLLDTMVMGDGWVVFGLSSHQATHLIERIGGRVISRERPRGIEPHFTSTRGTNEGHAAAAESSALDCERLLRDVADPKVGTS